MLLGGGYVALELLAILDAFGCEVTLLHRGPPRTLSSRRGPRGAHS